MKKIVLTGGGTAGHVTPNIALIEQLSNSCQLHYIGTSGMESALIAPFVKNGNIIYHTITAHKLKRKLCMGNFLLPMRLIKSINEATKILREIQPDLIFSKGGYVALPVVIAGHKLKIDCVMHESDITLGLANKLSAPFCKKVFTAFPSTKCKNKQYVGTLIRKNIKEGNRSKGLQFMNFDGSKPILLVFGGSLGAKTLNNTIIQCQELSEKFDIFVLTGKNKRVDSKILHQAEYADNIGDLYKASSVCVTRGGSNSLFELSICRLPFVCIPLEKSSRGEQIKNAEYFTDNKCGISISEARLNPITLTSAVNTLYQSSNAFPCVKKDFDGTMKVVEYLLNYKV